MHKRIRMLCLMLSFILFTQSVLPAKASENAVKQETAFIEPYVNPLYEDIYDENTIEEEAPAAYSAEQAEVIEEAPIAKASYTADANVIARTIRQGMVNRDATITFHYTDKKGYNAEDLKNWFQKALAETDNSEEGDYLRWNYAKYEGSVSYYDDGNRYYYDYTLNFTYYTTRAQEDELNEEIARVLNELGVKDDAILDDEKTKRIYDYVCENITYDNENLNDDSYKLKFTAYAAMMHKTAVCQGYATLMYRMLEECGIDTRVVFGTSSGQNHTWTLSNLGYYYYLSDATWDAGDTEYTYYLKSKNDFGNHTATSTFLDEYDIAESDYPEHAHPGKVTVEAKAAGCTEDGWTEETRCSTCGIIMTKSKAVKATGHDYVNNICTRCGQEKPYTQITFTEEYTNEAYLGDPVAIPRDTVKITEGNPEYQVKYYVDEACTTPTFAGNTSKEGSEPVEAGVYYAIVFTEETDEYRYTETKTPHKFIIRPRRVASLDAVNHATTIKLTWEGREEADGYIVYRKTDSTDYKVVATITDAEKLSFVDANISQKVKYRYNIAAFAVDENGEQATGLKRSNGTNIVRTKVISTTNQNGSVTVKWTKVPDAAGYKIYRKASGYSSYGLLKTIKNGDTTTYTDKYEKSIRNGKASYYYVVPYYKKSSDVILKTNTKTNYYMSRPVVSSLKRNSSTAITVKWKKNDKATGYEIRCSTSSSMTNPKSVKIKSKNTVSKKITGLQKNKTYYIQVRTYKTYDGVKYYSAWSTKKAI